MKTGFRFLLASLLLVFSFSMAALGQETTGSIDITVKDANGAVVPNVSITVTSVSATGFKRTVTTNSEGSIRVLQVPPGTYTVVAAPIQGFVESKLDNITVGLGQATPVSIEMRTPQQTVNVDVNAGEVAPIDVTDTKIQTTISAQAADLLPKGNNFSSILKVSPATRPEPRSGQFQIDGASGSENTFIIDGQEVTNVLSGTLDANTNLPFSQVQEVQVKSSGFEAEYGGATGGVINVVTKGGNDSLHGEFGILLRSSKLEPIAGPVLRSNNGQPEYYPQRYTQYNETNPTVNLSGPILKHKAWFIFDWEPQLFSQSKTLIFLDASRVPTGRVDTYHFKQRQEKSRVRFDGQPFQRLHLTGTFNWNPITQTGAQLGFSNELQNSLTFPGPSYYDNTGGRQNSMNYTMSGTYLATNKLIVTARYGHYFLNEKLGNYGIDTPDPNRPRTTCASAPFSTTEFPAGFGCSRNAPNNTNGVTAVANTEYDVTTRNQFDADATYSASFGGRHEFKGGYQNNAIGNSVLYSQTDLITLRSGTTTFATIASFSGRNIPSTPGARGSGSLTIFGTSGNVSSANQGIYIQDRWQPTKRLTANLGVRLEKEDVPSYAQGLPGIKFGWGSKIAPRLGVAYDITGDGKTKVSAFYGLFYDRFKLTLPRGSFGGDLYHTFYFEWFANDTINTINRETIFGGGSPIPGGACPTGTLTPVFGRVRCDVDFRVPSNSGGPLTQVGGIDPNIKPFQQREITFTFQRQLTKSYVFSARYTRKEVLHIIEDAGFPNESNSEYYIIGNPGEGLYKEQADMFGTIALKPVRQYDALELRLERRLGKDYGFNLNYTYSRLYGNYGGLASSDEEGRTDPNVNRYFDQPQAGFTTLGGPDTGRLATDRPHVFKFDGWYELNWSRFGLWKNNYTQFKVFTTGASGTPITSFFDLNNIAQIVLTKRGDQGRTPFFTNTDFGINHYIKLGRDGRFKLRLNADALNVFNQYIVTNKGLNPSGQGGNIINTTNFDPLGAAYHLVTPEQAAHCATAASPTQCRLVAAYATYQRQGSPELLAAAQAASGHNPFYNLPSAWNAKRQIRYGISLIF